uniref:RxLR effector candidate protein n=1 Tax=Hyaloperonospora arabidopsidis (strain Emoy2) TaxID=559515 RepID=M4BYD9_HYAAE
MGACFPMALLRHRMCLVVLVDETHQRQSTAGRKAPSCRGTADSRASEQDNSFATPSRHGGSRYAPRGSFDHRANPPMAVVREGISTPNLSELQAEVGRLQQRGHDLCDPIEQERQERLSFFGGVGATHPPLSIGRPIGVRVLPIGERAGALSLSRRSG